MNNDLEISFIMTEEEKERIKRILLENGGVRHYLLKLTDGTELDVIEYKKFQDLEIENQKLKKQLEVGKEQYNNLVEEKEELKSLYDSTFLENEKYKEVIDTLEFIKARAKEGATQETINKLTISFINSYIRW